MTRKRAVLYAAMCTSFMTSFMSSALNLSVPALESHFQVSAATISWIVTTYTIAIAAMSLPFGKIADQTGRRRVFLTGIAGFGIFSVLCIFSGSIWTILVYRALQGGCAAMIFATNNAILITCYPHEEQGKAIGYAVAATYVGLSAGPAVGGILNSTFGWRSIFLCSVVISFASFWLALRATSGIPDTSGKLQKSFDRTGSLIYFAAIITSLYGLTSLKSQTAGPFCLAAGILLLALFFLYEKRNADPIMKVSMFLESRTFTFSNLAALLNYGATFAISYTISIYLQVVCGIESGRAGLILVMMPLVQAVFSPAAGSLSDRIRPSVLASVGMGICVLTLLLFSRLSLTTPLWYVILSLCLTGFGFALFSSPNMNAILQCVSPSDYGVANSIIATMRTYGQSVGMAILTIVTSVILGAGTLEHSAPEELLRMMHVSFLIFAVLCVAGLFFSLARNRE
ncbi:MAG: MFS transporter [Mogibacterium sp.]|nr:MFS transporter [Mogibacterium sp.]